MLDYGFEKLSVKKICESGRAAGEVPVASGTLDKIECIVSENFDIPVIESDNIKTNIVLSKEVTAPVSKGDIIGYMEISLNNELIESIDIISNTDCEKEYIPTFKDYVSLILKNM